MGKRYIKLQNQGNILGNLMLLNEMKNSVGYADKNGYFTKKAVAEIAICSYMVTSGGKMGDDIIDLINNANIEEGKNPPLQQAKMRMQILRVLGLVATDYNSEMYTITDFGNKVLERAFPISQDDIPDYSLLLEAFLGISTSSEVYNHNCDADFNCYLGYNICYAFSKMDYRIAVDEMPILTTYSLDEIDDYVKDAMELRAKNKAFPVDHPHFPKTQKGDPVADSTRTNITRTINQILRLCGIIEKKNVSINNRNYYICSSYGKLFVDDIYKKMKKSKFISPYEFRRTNIIDQKATCANGYNNILERGGYQADSLDKSIVFSPYQMIHESDADRLLGRTPKDPPVSSLEKIQAVSNSITGRASRLKPTFITQEDYINFIKKHISKENIIAEILSVKNSGKDKDSIINELVSRHEPDTKDCFYPFIHSLFKAMGIECRGEVGRIDALFQYDNFDIPAEIKSFTETPSYNMKGARQALENKIALYKKTEDLKYASLLIGYSHPDNTDEIQNFIDAVYEEWGIKILAIDLFSIVTMCVNTIWDEQKVDFNRLFSSQGIVEV